MFSLVGKDGRPAAIATLAAALAASTPFAASAAGFSQPPAGLRVIAGHVQPEFAQAPVVGPLPAAQILHLTIGLPLRNRAEARALAKAVADPRSPNYRHYLTPAQFESYFSPTPGDYAAVLAFANASQFAVTRTFADRMTLDLDASVPAVERAFHLQLLVHRRPDGSTFYAPSNEPAVSPATPILHVSGLDDYRPDEPLVRPHALSTLVPAAGRANPNLSSGPGGSFAGTDFRNAYARGAAQTGAGQCLALYEHAASFFPGDIAAYETKYHLPHLLPARVLLDGFDGIPTVSKNEVETALDIEVGLAMAPGISQIVVFEGNNHDSILAAMASPPPGVPRCNQLSASYTFGTDSHTQQIVDEMTLLHQSLFLASGDAGGYKGDTGDDRDLSSATIVGATQLALDDNFQWLSEVGAPFSGGGVETNQFTPSYQLNVPVGPAGGVSARRMLPDVAMVGVNADIFADKGSEFPVDGTSVATPLWGAETALINQQAKAVGLEPVGFLNNALYALASVPPLYAANFHDPVFGNNGIFSAGPGYDMVTGLGSPKASLIGALNPVPGANFSQLQITIMTGSDNLRADSDLQVGFTGIGGLGPFCLMRSNNGAPTGQCVGSGAGDEHGATGWDGWSTHTLTFDNRFANWTWAGKGTMTLTLTNHNGITENNDNWDIQAMTVTLSNPVTKKSVTLFNVGNFASPHVQGHCYWRFKPTGSPPTVSQTFELLPGTTPSNGCPSDN